MKKLLFVGILLCGGVIEGAAQETSEIEIENKTGLTLESRISSSAGSTLHMLNPGMNTVKTGESLDWIYVFEQADYANTQYILLEENRNSSLISGKAYIAIEKEKTRLRSGKMGYTIRIVDKSQKSEQMAAERKRREESGSIAPEHVQPAPKQEIGAAERKRRGELGPTVPKRIQLQPAPKMEERKREAAVLEARVAKLESTVSTFEERLKALEAKK